VTARSRVFIGILVAYALGVAFLLYRQMLDIDPRYRESAEESLVETAQLFATSIELASSDGGLNTENLGPLFHALHARPFRAEIYGIEKTRVELRATVVDAAGRVVYDSSGQHLGEDYSRWRDVRLALRGEYGARTTAEIEGDPGSTVMHVAATIRARGRPDGAILGAVSVGKPVLSFGRFVEAARRKTLLVGATSVVAVLLLVVIVSVWLVRPFGLVTDYVRYVRAQRSFSLPRLGRRALGVIGAAYDEMRDALAGRSHVADYVQTLTHEVKSPLSAIRGAAELLQEPMADADRARFASNILRETERIRQLVERMMELTALESRQRLEAPLRVPLRPLLLELAASVEPAAAARGQRVVVEAAATADAVAVDGDPLLLQRAVANLVDNALDFSPEGAIVTLDLARRGRSVDIIVRDRGPGIPEYAEGRVFEKFYSLARPHSKKKSTGMGLSFVREIAELHRGRAALRNHPEGGALATLSLPLADPA